MVLISVVIPVYNVEQYLRKCVDSVLAQSFQDFEIVLVDDGSSDMCGKICDKYMVADSRVHVIHQDNGGLSAARNSGIEWALKNSDSKWITFIDSDDWVCEDYLESLLCTVESTGCFVAVGGLRAIDEDGNLIFDRCECNMSVCPPEHIFCNYYSLATWACGKLFLKADFEKVRFPLGKFFEDRHTTHKILFKYQNVACVNHSTYIYFIARSGNITNKSGVKHALDRMSGLCCQIDYFLNYGFNKAAKVASLDCIAWLSSYGRKHPDMSDAENHRVSMALFECKRKYWNTIWRDLDIRYAYRCGVNRYFKLLWYSFWICGQIRNGNLSVVCSNIKMRVCVYIRKLAKRI